jgi:hypothetical protein
MARQDPAKSSGALNTLRHCLSEQQWRDALRTAKSQKPTDTFEQDQRDPGQPRQVAVRRCLLRVAREGRAPGIYLVRSSDICVQGVRVIHGGPIKPRTLCAVIIESTADYSLVAGGEVAWCNGIKDTDPPAYEIGIRLHQPIDTAAFVDGRDDGGQAA